MNIGQCLDFLQFSEGNRGDNEENRTKLEEKPKKVEEQIWKSRVSFLSEKFLI